MGRRGNGEGSISRRKDGLYMGRYMVQTATGTKRKALYGKTRQEVAAKLTRAMADRDNGLYFNADNLKVGEYLERWLADSVLDTIRPTTYERYEQIVRIHVRPALGSVKLKNLTPVHVRGLYREKLQAGLSPRTVQYIHVTLHKALKQAVQDGLIPRDATEAVKAPRVRRQEMRPLSAEQVKVFLETACGDRLEALFVLAIHTVLRQGELLGLKWEDVDLESGTLWVRRTLATTKGGPMLTAPKTKGSRRSVKLTQGALEVLRSHFKVQLQEDDKSWVLVAGERPGVRLRDRGTPGPPVPDQPPLQGTAGECRVAGDKISRSTPHVRNTTPGKEREPQDCLRDAWPCCHRHNPGHLLARTP
jgi:integrase